MLHRRPHDHRTEVPESHGAAETHRLQHRDRQQSGAHHPAAGVREPVEPVPHRALLVPHPARLVDVQVRGQVRRRRRRGHRQGEEAGQGGIRSGQEPGKAGGAGHSRRQQQGHHEPGDRQHPSANQGQHHHLARAGALLGHEHVLPAPGAFDHFSQVHELHPQLRSLR